MSKIVQLRAAKIPIIGLIAIHYWFVIVENSNISRWEIWQRANLNNSSWGHLHKNLMQYNQGVGNGNSWIEKQWHEKEANLLIKIIENSPENYIYHHKYLYWHGPNSNTYIQWVLNQAKINYSLNPRGIGKDYLGLIGFQTKQDFLQFYMPLFGFKICYKKYLEFHFFTLSFCINYQPLVIKTPFKIFQS